MLNNFMFGAVMMDPENCRLLLERVLEMEIHHVEVDKEKCLVYHPEYRGVRLDVFANDENHTHYNVEMQVEKTEVERRSRYYHSQINTELLLSGFSYDTLPDSFVIFICDFDPPGYGKYRYRIDSKCAEIDNRIFDDGRHIILLNTKGRNPDEVPEDLVHFLKYIGGDSSQNENETEDTLIKRLQDSVRDIKASWEMGARYMAFWDLIEKEKRESREEGRQDGLAEGREAERTNTERERKRADAAEAELKSLRQQLTAIRKMQEKPKKNKGELQELS